MPNPTIIFTHYGYSDYLEHTLRCALLTHRSSRLLFIGDDQNRAVALRNGWEHVDFSAIPVTPLHAEFRRQFRPVAGRHHPNSRNNGDWLKYVFERWYYVESLLREWRIGEFWHFDSDTMILEPLGQFYGDLIHIDATTQCNGICLNGFVRTPVVSEYCEKITALFKDEDFLRTQQAEFDTINPSFAFTEMRAFAEYSKGSPRTLLPLNTISNAYRFDDCICQPGIYKTITMPFGREVKQVIFDGPRCFIVRQDGENDRFATLNLSWVPIGLFQWVFDNRFK